MLSHSGHLPQIQTLLFFGSFDPITIAHSSIVSTGLELLEPEKIHLIPAHSQGWGKKLSSFGARRKMIECEIKLHSDWAERVEVNCVEKEAKLSGITADTLHHLRAGSLKDKRLGMLMGSDWILSLPTWEEWQWMLQTAPAFVALRGTDTVQSLKGKLHQDLLPLLGKSVFFLPEVETEATRHVSSTQVRTQIRQGLWSDLISKNVLEYIKNHQLYTRSLM